MASFSRSASAAPATGEIVSGASLARGAGAGLVKIPAVVRDDISDEISLELAIVENVQRQDLDPSRRPAATRRSWSEWV